MFYAFTTISTYDTTTFMEGPRNGNLAGNTYEDSDRNSLDFYADGTVVFHTNGADFTHRGSYEIWQPKNEMGPLYQLTVKIYVGANVTTWKGEFVTTRNTLKLNNKTWTLKYHVDD